MLPAQELPRGGSQAPLPNWQHAERVYRDCMNTLRLNSRAIKIVFPQKQISRRGLTGSGLASYV